MVTVSEALQDVKKLIDTPEKWTKGAYARTIHGDTVSQFSRFAERWCIVGACRAIAVRYSTTNIEIFLNQELRRGSQGIHQVIEPWNDCDETTFDDIHALLDAAIADPDNQIREWNKEKMKWVFP